MTPRRLPSILRGLGLCLALAATSGPAAAWTPATRIRMVDDAALLMPPALRLALERYRDDLRRGALGPTADESGAGHRPPWTGGRLDAEIGRAASELERTVADLRPFREIARRFGVLAHFVADAGFPPLASGGAPARFRHFAAFCESRRHKFPLVFYGYEDADLARGDWAAFGRRVLESARLEDGLLERAYLRAGDPPDPAAFDDRSVPFAVGSLTYSRAVTDIARAWLEAWTAAHGDTGRTPYGGALKAGR